MNFLKLITKSGRQSFVREMLTEYLTKDSIASYGREWVNKLIVSTCSGVDDAKMKTVCETGAEIAATVNAITLAVADKEVSAKEADDIATHVQTLTGKVITDEMVGTVIDKIVSYIP